MLDLTVYGLRSAIVRLPGHQGISHLCEGKQNKTKNSWFNLSKQFVSSITLGVPAIITGGYEWYVFTGPF